MPKQTDQPNLENVLFLILNEIRRANELKEMELKSKQPVERLQYRNASLI